MKNKIFKIFTIVVMLSLILSLVCVNASAFERENSYVDIEGDEDYQGVTCAPGSIYGDDYALILCGDICGTYGWGGEPSSIPFKDLSVLNRFLGDVSRGIFVSPTGKYSSSDYETLNYLEFYSLDRWNGDLYSLGIYPVGLESDLILANGHVYVREVSAGAEYTWNFSTSFADSCYFAVDHHCLVVACYFDDFTPYDDPDDAPPLIKYYYDFDQQLTLEKQVSEQRLNIINDLKYQRDELVMERDALIIECEVLDFKYNKLLYEEKNYDFIGLIFTGPAAAIVNSIQDLSGLGFDYNHDNVNDLTIGGLFVVALLGAFIIFLLRLVFGKGGSSS